ncbi:unnamed protein product [Paramecium octaurelia]|uniref:Uncharacterized protein n=1 Tax=Paramecium octaurelia TaxID=43137 RepID=A0A8S1SB74_PAROT|nr:unnamed protein product [Paramecium octaurelia]
MSEIEELTKQKQVLEAQQSLLENWIVLKKNLSSKFKNPSEAFKCLVKDNAKELTIQDFDDYAKGINLNELFKDQHLNEETFIKIWESWEFNYKANQHKLQMIEEKLEVLVILEDKDAKMFKGDSNKKKLIVSQIQGCENLEDLHKKLGEMVQNNTDQKQKDGVAPNESDVFSQFLAKKSQIQFSELSISKMQTKLAEIPQQAESSDSAQKQKLEQPLVESQIIVIGKVTLPKKSYLDSQHSIIHKRGNYSTNQSKTFINDSNAIKIVSPKVARPKDQFISPKNFQQPSNFEENDQIRRSQKSKKLKGDLQHYIEELFHGDHHQKNPYEFQTKGLQGFNYKKNQKTVQHRIELRPTESVESQNIQKRVQNIRNKLDEYQNKRTRKQSPQKPYTSGNALIKTDITPERRYSQGRSSPYTPGNVHRLNVDRLKQEKEITQKQNSDKKPQINEEDDIPQKGLDRQKAFISD